MSNRSEVLDPMTVSPIDDFVDDIIKHRAEMSRDGATTPVQSVSALTFENLDTIEFYD